MKSKTNLIIRFSYENCEYKIFGVYETEEDFFCRVVDINSGVERKIFGADAKNAIECSVNFVLSLSAI